MPWPVLAKVGLAVGTTLLLEHGDDIVDGVMSLFEDKPEERKPEVVRGLDNQLASQEKLMEVGARGMPKLNAKQSSAASVIASVCNVLEIFTPDERRGICMALWVNAWHESRLRTEAHNPKGEDSRGLFQVNVRAHPYWKDVNLYDPAKNTACILILALKQPKFLEAVASGSLAQLVYVVCRYVERPKNAHQSALRRVETARQWYGANI